MEKLRKRRREKNFLANAQHGVDEFLIGATNASAVQNHFTVMLSVTKVVLAGAGTF